MSEAPPYSLSRALPFRTPMASYDDVMSLSVRRGFLWPAVDLYGGFGGFYDYGHNGVLLRRRWEDLWIETFLGLSDNYYLIDTTTILPEAALKASGHVDQFTDILVTCTRCGESYRGDHLLATKTHEEHEGLTLEEIDERIRELKILSAPATFAALARIGAAGSEPLQIAWAHEKNDPTANDVSPKDAVGRGLPSWYVYHLIQVQRFYLNALRVPRDAFRFAELDEKERAFYNKIHFDVQVKQESLGGFKEVGGVHYRTDHDLKGHESGSHAKQSVTFGSSKLVPHVLELSFGVDRNVWALLDLTFHKAERAVLRLPPRLAPIAVAVFPLVNKDGIPEHAERVYAQLQRRFTAFFDDSGSIGRRYARMDEIGTPVSVTVDHDTLAGKGVTVRERDSQKQIRLKEADVAETLTRLLSGESSFVA